MLYSFHLTLAWLAKHTRKDPLGDTETRAAGRRAKSRHLCLHHHSRLPLGPDCMTGPCEPQALLQRARGGSTQHSSVLVCRGKRLDEAELKVT